MMKLVSIEDRDPEEILSRVLYHLDVELDLAHQEQNKHRYTDCLDACDVLICMNINDDDESPLFERDGWPIDWRPLAQRMADRLESDRLESDRLESDR